MFAPSTTLYWIEGPWKGRLAILPRPRGGDWLEDEVRAWRGVGVDVVVSALEEEEIAELELAQEAEFCQASGLDFRTFPIPDRGMPGSFRTTAELIRQLGDLVASGKSVIIHCRQGVGRSALLAACVMIAMGGDIAKVWESIGAARKCPVPDTNEQREWVAKFAQVMSTTVSE